MPRASGKEWRQFRSLGGGATNVYWAEARDAAETLRPPEQAPCRVTWPRRLRACRAMVAGALEAGWEGAAVSQQVTLECAQLQ